MVAKIKQEYVAAGLRQQIRSLAQVMEEMESERLESEAIAWRLKAVEINLRRLREAA
jgi:hypothetical protein